MIEGINERSRMTCTFNTTEDCNLACKYCYEINKCRRTLSLDYAKQFIDLLLREKNATGDDNPLKDFDKGVILDFIGGDALMKPELCESIIEYWIKQVNTLDTPNALKWRNDWMISIATNGTLFSNPKVRDFCERWKEVMSVGVSIDGCPELHDMNRVYVDGRPSMENILKNWEWYKRIFPMQSLTTKSTLSRNSIPYIYDSLKWMHETLGLKYINQNFIMEDTHCTEEDYRLLKEQMDKCVYYTLDHCDDLYWSMMDKHHFADHHAPESDEDWNTRGWCGSGSMPALGIDGGIYPCFRWLPHTNSSGHGIMCVGNVKDGFDHKENFKKVRDGGIRANCTKKEECRTCPYESACSYCIGGCYAEFGEFKRTTYICEITKIQCEYAKKYWNLYNEKKGLPKEFEIDEEFMKY